MSKETFDFSEALRRMKEGKKVRRKIFADGTYAYIDKNYLGSEALMYNSVGRATPVLWLLPKTIFFNRLGGGGMMEKKVLTLTVSKQWFDKIVSGEKTEEYREIKPYWVARLFHNNSNVVDVRNLASALAGRTDLLKKYIDAQRIVLKQYTHVLFINGYRKDSPRIEKEIESITIGKPKKGLCPNKWLDTEFFIIKFK